MTGITNGNPGVIKHGDGHLAPSPDPFTVRQWLAPPDCAWRPNL